MKEMLEKIEGRTGRRRTVGRAGDAAVLWSPRALAGLGTPREWLPVPATPMQVESGPRRRRGSSLVSTVIEEVADKLVPAGLALAAVSGLCYGLSLLVDLIQHWAGFTAQAAQFAG